MSDRGEAHPTSPELRQKIWELGIVLARRQPEDLERCLGDLAQVASDGSTGQAVEEAILQSLLFLGFPTALTALARWRRLAGPSLDEETRPTNPEPTPGETVCLAVYGSAYAKLRERMRGLHPDADRWMVEDGYGKVMGRAGLDLPTRELLNVALLAATDFPDQLHSHLRGALRVGASRDQVQAALEGGIEALPAERQEALRALWGEVEKRA